MLRARSTAARWAAAAAAAMLAAMSPLPAARSAAAQAPPGGAPPASSPPPAGTTPRPPVPVDVTGAERIEYDAATEEYIFLGMDVVVTRGDQRMEAPEIRYNGARRRAVLPRHGTITSAAMSMEADALTADLGVRHILADGHVRGRFLDSGVWATVTAARIEADDRPDLRRVDAAGDAASQVVIVRGDQELRGSRIVYDRTLQHGTVEGRAIAVRGGDRLEADHIEGDLGTRNGEATGHVVLDRPAVHMHGTADRATYSGSADTVVLTGHAVVTRDRDSLAADQITVHLSGNRAVADGHPKIVAYPSSSSP